ncbi:hypothetical protein V8C26DRAFT_408146 [Trichoderma gracile]
MMWMRQLNRYFIHCDSPRAPVWQVLALSCKSGFDTIHRCRQQVTMTVFRLVSSRFVSSRFVPSLPNPSSMLAFVLLSSKCRTSGCVPFEALGEYLSIIARQEIPR